MKPRETQEQIIMKRRIKSHFLLLLIFVYFSPPTPSKVFKHYAYSCTNILVSFGSVVLFSSAESCTVISLTHFSQKHFYHFILSAEVNMMSLMIFLKQAVSNPRNFVIFHYHIIFGLEYLFCHLSCDVHGRTIIPGDGRFWMWESDVIIPICVSYAPVPQRSHSLTHLNEERKMN